VREFDAVGIRDLLLGTEKRFYCICFSCRSGSTLLANDLKWNGLGEPFEHFHVERPREAKDRSFAQTICDLVAESEGEFFGFKIALNQLHSLTERLRRQGDLSVTSDLRSVFPGLRFVSMRRTDKVAQAVSYWRALVTDQWHTGAGTTQDPGRPEYDFDAIKEALLAVVTEDWLWDAHFVANGIECHHVVYEDYLQGRLSTLEAIFDYLGVTSPPVTPVVDGTSVMRDDWSNEIVTRTWEDLTAQAFRGLQLGDFETNAVLAAPAAYAEFLGPIASVRKLTS
jgi:LPS sulfotransferase NodH